MTKSDSLRSAGPSQVVAPWPVMATEAVPTSEVFLDERGSLLRVRWDEGRQQLAISIWQDDRCVASHRLALADTARLSTLLTQAWIDGLRREAAEAR